LTLGALRCLEHLGELAGFLGRWSGGSDLEEAGRFLARDLYGLALDRQT